VSEHLPLGAPFDTLPPEDVGATTHARYRYQWEVGARVCLAMLGEDGPSAILCEWHEDHVVFYGDGTAELVSVKHREVSEGPWTLRGLCVDGGVAHLFQRWLGLERVPRCRVATNGGLNTGPGESRAFVDACHSRDPEAIRRFGPQIQGHLGAATVEDVIAFCLILSVESGIPGRAHIAASNIQDLLAPGLAHLRVSAADPRRVYEACVGLVEGASRDVGQRVTLGSMADVNRLATRVTTAALLESRLVTRSQVRSCVMNALTSGGFPLAPTRPVMSRSVLIRKLERGGIGPTSRHSAQRERALWAELEARYRSDLPGVNSELEDLRTRVLDLVSAAEVEVLSKDHAVQYGAALLAKVRDTLQVGRLTRTPALPIEDVHLLGLAFQLTDECEVWWSEEFDVEAAV
jgi:Cap4 dsDNA endonuclease